MKANIVIPFYSSYGTPPQARAGRDGRPPARDPRRPPPGRRHHLGHAYPVWQYRSEIGKAAQVKQFIDTLGGMWFEGELEGKATGVFVSTGSIHGGHETTIPTSLVLLRLRT